MTRGLRASQIGTSLAMKNKIINGCFRLWQRGTLSTGITGNDTRRSADRWSFWTTSAGANYSAGQSTTVVPDANTFASYSVGVAVADAVTPTAGEQVGIYQAVEGYNFHPLFGNIVTLSFWVRSGKTGVFCVSFRNTDATKSYVVEYTVNVANTWEKKTITISMNYSGNSNFTNGAGLWVVFAIVMGSTFQTTANAWQNGNYLATANQVNFGDNTANTLYLANVQLEQGGASAFEVRDYGTELSLCQRYCEKLTLSITGQQDPVYYAWLTWFYKVTKRATAIITNNGSSYTTVYDSRTDGICVYHTTLGQPAIFGENTIADAEL